jgi:hypothetical protein
MTGATASPLLFSGLNQGDRVIYRGPPSPCLKAGQAYTVEADTEGDLHIDCAAGHHYLEGHVDAADELLHFEKVAAQ